MRVGGGLFPRPILSTPTTGGTFPCAPKAFASGNARTASPPCPAIDRPPPGRDGGRLFVRDTRLRDGDVREVAYEHFEKLALKILARLKNSR